MNIVEAIRTGAREYLDKAAVIDGSRQFTYQQLFHDVDERRDFLRGQDIFKYSRVALHYPDSYDYIVLSLALLEMGAVVVPVPFNSSSDEVEDIVTKIDAHFLLSVRDNGLIIKRLTSSYNLYTDFHGLDPAFIRFSSGTTGAAKGVILSHQSIIERTDCANEGLKISSTDNILWLLQMSYHFVVTILLFLRKGAAIVLCGDDFLRKAENALCGQTITFIYASPFHYEAFIGCTVFDSSFFKSLRMAVSTAMKLPDKIRSDFFIRFEKQLTEAYGIIEVGLPFINIEHIPDSVGKPLPDYSVKIERPDAVGVGRVFIKGPGMVDAYFFPFTIRKDILKDGWFDTGDLGRLDGEGNLYICGREKSVINFAGMKIFPQEVEEVINRYDGVNESLVYALKDEQYGELPVAKIVTKENSKIDIDELRKFCYKHLAKYKVPKAIELVCSLEKTASGKIKR